MMRFIDKIISYALINLLNIELLVTTRGMKLRTAASGHLLTSSLSPVDRQLCRAKQSMNLLPGECVLTARCSHSNLSGCIQLLYHLPFRNDRTSAMSPRLFSALPAIRRSSLKYVAALEASPAARADLPAPCRLLYRPGDRRSVDR